MRILFVEDNPRLSTPTAHSLTKAGFAVDVFEDVEEAWCMWRDTPYDVVILDIMLGRQSGLDLLERARQAGLTTPVLMLTALSEVDDRVHGLNRGADDYLPKPFAFDELVARLRALARRPDAAVGPVLRLGDLAFDTTTREAAVGDRRVALPRSEGVALELFLRAPGRIRTKEELGERLHSCVSEYTDNSIQVQSDSASQARPRNRRRRCRTGCWSRAGASRVTPPLGVRREGGGLRSFVTGVLALDGE